MPRDPGAQLPHQAEGTEFLRRNERAALFDEQGLGKSKQLIDAIAAQIAAGELAGAVIVCPNGLKTNWAEEIAKFSDLSVAVFGAGRKARRSSFAKLRAAFYVINYEAVGAELAALKALLRFKPMALVLDESHRIKTPEAKVTEAVLQLRASARRRYILSGTPVANKPEDLWSQFYFLDDGDALGATLSEFRGRYQSAGGGYTSLDDLRDRVGGISKRRLKDTAVALPAKTVSRLRLEITGRQLELYDGMRNELAVWVQSMNGAQVLREAEAILARLVRLAQIASDPSMLDASYDEQPCKLIALDGLLEEHFAEPDAHKVIVWTSFVANIASLQRRYPQYRPTTLHGALSGPERDASVRAFKGDPEVRLMIANPAAAREGLTLTEANVAIYLDRTFNLVDYLQSQDRIHRISQGTDCRIVLLLAKDSIDEFVDFCLEQKARLARFVQQDVDSVLPADAALEKPDILRALLWPEANQGEGG
ncbi:MULTISPECIES: DEAD/DEAH box helicase [unclassified Bradyrhizobium]|uniref:DEAD/DEAH box helicase n=1 Tax=unclassified Bradyrhizobium TaxID=2631580 RepID=UPI001FFB903A|nr:MULTISPECIES: DEAD/DEAH box helicase [unclassified Bradyrhizobium]MCK1539820.1 DEAD/DEAH box helicase [Bradyrhizobium sp. 176]MCK1561622.1 DEAD/DEAH box helicase [Bradyrhizobium sp. 171]MCK1698225.1 DEAD/DEAH box helicase [Bradyrhizobium sp. 144]